MATDAVLRDSALDGALAREGIVQVPLIGPQLLKVVEQEYRNLVPDVEGAIQLDYLRQDRALVRKLADLADTLWAESIPTVFEQHYPIYSSFVMKYPGADSSLFLHRDLCVDDERFRTTYAMWMPFVDTSPELDNGPLSFVLESQHIRHGAFGPNAAVLFDPYSESLREWLQPMSVPAGTALVYDAKMLHASTPNNSLKPRMAVGCLLARRDQPVIQVLGTGRRGREVREVDRDYFIESSPGQIASEGIADKYPLIDSFEEHPGTLAGDVLPPLLRHGSQRQQAIPEDQRAFVSDHSRLPVRRTFLEGLDHDLRVSSRHAGFAPHTAVQSMQITRTGGVGALELVRGWRRVNKAPQPLAGVDLQLRSLHETYDASVIVIDPGGRAELTFAGTKWLRSEVIVLDCPPVTAGVALTGCAAEAEPGVSVAAVPAEPMRWWNGGPGPLVLLVKRGVIQRLRRAGGRQRTGHLLGSGSL